MDHKDGVKTSEFWTSIVTLLAGLIPAVVAVLDGQPWAAAVFSAVGLAGPVIYIAGRAWLKAEAARTVDVIPEKWEPALEAGLDLLERLGDAIETRENQPPDARAASGSADNDSADIDAGAERPAAS